MDKRQRIENILAGHPVDRVPVSLWRHWPGDDQLAADFARATVDFQRAYDWDFVKVNPSRTYCVADYGLRSEWKGDPHGDRQITKHAVNRSLNWTELRVLDPMRGALAKHVTALQMIREALPQTPVVTTIYSPLTQARMLSENDLALRNMRTHPDRLRTGLNVITDSILLLLESLRRVGIDGIFYVMDAADFALMSVEEYAKFGLQHDRKILDALPESWWLNVLHLVGSAPMIDFTATFPLPAICWDAHSTRPDIEKARSIFKGTLFTGLSSEVHLGYGTPSLIRDTVRKVINQVDSRRLILTAGSSVPVMTPLANLRAVRNAVEVADVI